MENEGKKNDYLDRKLRWDLLPLKEIEDIVLVYTKGSEKYGDNNWQHLENGIQRYKAALLRHLVEFEKGNDIDQETGCRHLAQVAWNAIAMLYLSKQDCQNQEGNSNRSLSKYDEVVKALDSKIEEKIDNCNQLLDEIGKGLRGKDLENIAKQDKKKKAYSLLNTWLVELRIYSDIDVYFNYYEDCGDCKYNLVIDRSTEENPNACTIEIHKSLIDIVNRVYELMVLTNRDKDAIEIEKENILKEITDGTIEI